MFTRDEDDLRTQVAIDIASAALGTSIPVPTIDGKTAEVTVPAGTQTGTVLKLKGKGLPTLSTSSRGNLLVGVNVNVPLKLTEKQKELLKEFKQIEDEKKKGSFFHF
jgi:molecular chaperone DnaJ